MLPQYRNRSLVKGVNSDMVELMPEIQPFVSLERIMARKQAEEQLEAEARTRDEKNYTPYE